MGVVCVDSGYQVHVGRRGRHGPAEHQAACARSPTEDEALEVIVAFIQLYREQAHYLDRIYKWLEGRAGLDQGGRCR
jgi:nitrite reductase (NADH) large subunit